MPGTRIKYLILAAVAVAAGLGILAATQLWFVLHLTAAAGHDAPVDVAGSLAAPALTALSLAALALVAAFAIAGRLLRLVLGVLGIILGGCVILAAALAMGNPVHSSVSAVTKATGVAGDTPVADLVASVDSSLWPAAALTAGILLAAACYAAIITAKAWPGPSRKYQAVRFEQADPDTEGTESKRDRAIDSWDELSRGDDPTA